MTRPALLFAALIAALLTSSCVPPLLSCSIEGDPGTVWNDAFCQDPCYVDADGDGHGGELVLLELDEVCPETTDEGVRTATLGGDCVDSDPNEFPGNREVCDGRDNDCNDETWADVEEEEELEPGVYSCSPVAPEAFIQLFLLAGSTIAVDGEIEPINPVSGQVEVRPGQRLEAKVRIRTVVRPGLADLITGGLVTSWGQPRQATFKPLWDQQTSPEAGVTDWEFDAPPFMIPEDIGPEGTAHYVTLGAGLAPQPEYLGSLTWPWYCEDMDGPATPPCDPVWGVLPGFDEADNPDRDLADLDELDLAACQVYGTARMPILWQAIDQAGDPCTPSESNKDTCFPIYADLAMGCAFVKLVVGE
jgi:hypothetical protein